MAMFEVIPSQTNYKAQEIVELMFINIMAYLKILLVIEMCYLQAHSGDTWIP